MWEIVAGICFTDPATPTEWRTGVSLPPLHAGSVLTPFAERGTTQPNKWHLGRGHFRQISRTNGTSCSEGVSVLTEGAAQCTHGLMHVVEGVVMMDVSFANILLSQPLGKQQVQCFIVLCMAVNILGEVGESGRGCGMVEVPRDDNEGLWMRRQ